MLVESFWKLLSNNSTVLQELISLPVTDNTVGDTIMEPSLFIAEGLKSVLELLQSVQHSSAFSELKAPQLVWE